MRAERHFRALITIRSVSADATTMPGPARANLEDRSDTNLDEPISPELVLVDPGLRSLVLNGGPGEGPTPSLPAFASTKQDESLPEQDRVRSSGIRTSWMQLALAGLCGSIVTIGAGLAIAGLPFSSAGAGSERAAGTTEAVSTVPMSEADPVSANAGAEQDGTGSRSASTTSTQPPSDSGPAETVPPARRFAWAPVHGATGYEVAIYKDDVPVFRARTKTPSIVIPERSPQKGSAPLLAPGTYQWYVWPVRNGQADRVASVRSTLVIPAR
jgi:hypothetical protein